MTFLESVLVAAAVAGAFGVAVRQTVRMRVARMRAAVNRLANDIVQNAGEGIVVVDCDLRYLVWNRFMEELTGKTASDVLGRTVLESFPHLADDNIMKLFARALRGETVVSPDTHYEVAETGREGWISAVYRPHVEHQGRIEGVVVMVRDVTQRKAAEQQIEYQAYHDALTGLANRHLFQEHLALALALSQRRNTKVAVLFLDLDNFKDVNDSLGHSIGDVILRQVARRLRVSVREGDTVARVGGDEFTIVLQDLVDRADASAVAEKILRTIAEPIEASGQQLFITTSIGIAVSPEDGSDTEELLKNADAAMYRAKSDGRNTIQVASRSLGESTRQRMTLETELHLALAREELTILYQPQLETDTMEIVGVEALVRWQHPVRGVIAPEEFIPLAEEKGLILPIGEWILREACMRIRRFHDAGRPNFRISVNLSARQFRDPRLLGIIESAIADAGIAPETLELEITETVAMENVKLTISTLSKLRKAGITIAIDDFGTGHSSLGYLKRFEIDALKIDRSFVTDLPDKFEDAAIVSSVIQLANGLGLRVVAEGVERREQFDFLRENGCREVQGFLFSYPVTLDRIDELLREETSSRAPVERTAITGF